MQKVQEENSFPRTISLLLCWPAALGRGRGCLACKQSHQSRDGKGSKKKKKLNTIFSGGYMRCPLSFCAPLPLHYLLLSAPAPHSARIGRQYLYAYPRPITTALLSLCIFLFLKYTAYAIFCCKISQMFVDFSENYSHREKRIF